jgi:hypothetical protein
MMEDPIPPRDPDGEDEDKQENDGEEQRSDEPPVVCEPGAN